MTRELGISVALGLPKNFLKLVGLSLLSPVVILVTSCLFLVWVFIVCYSLISGKDETKIEERIEHIVEKNVESALSLPSGTLEDKLDFMVQPSRKEGDDK